MCSLQLGRVPAPGDPAEISSLFQARKRRGLVGQGAMCTWRPWRCLQMAWGRRWSRSKWWFISVLSAKRLNAVFIGVWCDEYNVRAAPTDSRDHREQDGLQAVFRRVGVRRSEHHRGKHPPGEDQQSRLSRCRQRSGRRRLPPAHQPLWRTVPAAWWSRRKGVEFYEDF